MGLHTYQIKETNFGSFIAYKAENEWFHFHLQFLRVLDTIDKKVTILVRIPRKLWVRDIGTNFTQKYGFQIWPYLTRAWLPSKSKLGDVIGSNDINYRYLRKNDPEIMCRTACASNFLWPFSCPTHVTDLSVSPFYSYRTFLSYTLALCWVWALGDPYSPQC